MTIQVEWAKGSEVGFRDIATAERFIDRVGKVVAPNTEFKVSNLLAIPL